MSPACGIAFTVKELPTWYRNSFHLSGIATWFIKIESSQLSSRMILGWHEHTRSCSSLRNRNLGLLLPFFKKTSIFKGDEIALTHKWFGPRKRAQKLRAPSRWKSRRSFGYKEHQWIAPSFSRLSMSYEVLQIFSRFSNQENSFRQCQKKECHCTSLCRWGWSLQKDNSSASIVPVASTHEFPQCLMLLRVIAQRL